MTNIASENGIKAARTIAVETLLLALKRGEKLLFEKMTWRLPAGKFLAVTGASGAGKSSLLACLGGIVAPSAGEFKLAVADSKSIGFIYQDFRLTTNLSVLTNVLCGKLGDYAWWQTLFSFSETDRRAAFAILRELGLEKLVHRQARKFPAANGSDVPWRAFCCKTRRLFWQTSRPRTSTRNWREKSCQFCAMAARKKIKQSSPFCTTP